MNVCKHRAFTPVLVLTAVWLLAGCQAGTKKKDDTLSANVLKVTTSTSVTTIPEADTVLIDSTGRFDGDQLVLLVDDPGKYLLAQKPEHRFNDASHATVTTVKAYDPVDGISSNPLRDVSASTGAYFPTAGRYVLTLQITGGDGIWEIDSTGS